MSAKSLLLVAGAGLTLALAACTNPSEARLCSLVANPIEGGCTQETPMVNVPAAPVIPN